MNPTNKQQQFFHWGKNLFSQLKGNESATLSLAAEETEFTRFNHSLIRQHTWVKQCQIFLKYQKEEIPGVINRWVDVLVEKGLLFEQDNGLISRPEEGTDAMLRLRVLSRFIIQTLERYHIAIGVLRRYGSGKVNAEELEEQCTLLAERMSILFGLNAPEFFDKSLFRNFITSLQSNGVVTKDENGLLCYSNALDEVAEDARLVLSVEKRQAIQQVTMLGA
jgi:glycerol-3-phosphate O-acyltransferase